MTTSGSYDHTLTANGIITEALEIIGVVGTGKTLQSEDQATCLRTLNLMIKAWQAEGIGLWKNVEAFLFPSYEGTSYDIGPTGDHCSTAAYKTEIATAAVSGASTITVDSDDDITNLDKIGIELDDKTVQWTTVNGTPAANVVTLLDALTDDVSVDNHVYNYTTKIQRPTEILEARTVSPSNYQTPIMVISRDEYMRLSDKTSKGQANQVFYDPVLTNGKMYVWPACADVQEYIKFSARILIEDVDDATNNFDFPQEWNLALSWNLASLVASKFGKVMSDKDELKAAGMFLSLKGYDTENTSIFIKAR